MKPIASIYAEHAYAPRISTTITLSAWGIQYFKDLQSLLQLAFSFAELKEIWQYGNGQSVAAATMPRKQMLKYFWSKRPTAVTIRYTDGTSDKFPIGYPKGSESLLNILDRKPLGYKAYI